MAGGVQAAQKQEYDEVEGRKRGETVSGRRVERVERVERGENEWRS